MVGRIVLRGGADDIMGVGQVLLNALQLLAKLCALPSLGQQGVLDNTGVAIQQRGSFSAEVLQDLKAFAADVLQVPVLAGRALAVRLAVRLAVLLGIGLRLWVR